MAASGSAPPTAAVLPERALAPLDAAEFARLMEPFAPFEPQPHLAVALSGGGDSMALTLLAGEWARARRGHVTALTVDHGLRPEAAAEAAQAGAWCAARGIAHVILCRTGPAPRSGIQAAARAARYRLLEAWCAQEGVLHLLLGHQREDQAETLLMRLDRGSSATGLAGMASVSERRFVRLLRPLLGVPRATLRATLRARGQGWIEDPSNRNPVFARVRWREALRAGSHGLSAEGLAEAARRLGRARTALEAETARLLASAVVLHPLGFATLDRGIVTAPAELRLLALAAAILAVGGADYPPRRERLERLSAALAAEPERAGWTLGGCRLLAFRGKLLLCREPSAVAAPVPAVPGQSLVWDRRFFAIFDEALPSGLWLGALGRDAAAVRRALDPRRAALIPAAILPSLPALRDAKGVVAVPLLEYFQSASIGSLAACRVAFRPNRSLTAAGFRIV